LKVLR
jgi:hypothetical protein